MMQIRSTHRRAVEKRTAAARGFTIVELLVVIGIIVLLASILMVVGSRAFRAADSTRIAAQLQMIDRALEAYKTDFGSFPTTNAITVANVSDEINRNELRGARTLCKALIGATSQGQIIAGAFNMAREDQDGHTGPGFRVLPRSGAFKIDTKNTATTTDDELGGTVYGPYIQGGALKWTKTKDAADPGNGLPDVGTDYDDTTVLLDANGNVILYYPVLNSQPVMSVQNAYIGSGPTTALPNVIMPMYRWTDNSGYGTESAPTLKMTEEKFKTLLGDTTQDGAINRNAADNETARVKTKYLLISAGRDGIFGPNQNDKNKTNDDVTNFME